MSYSIYIGEPELEECINPKDYDGEFIARYSVNCINDHEAPVFENDETTGNSNSRHPGYGAWADFVRSVGLHDLFFDKYKGLMRKHPGCFSLTKEHGDKISEALQAYKAKYSNVKPGFTTPYMSNSGVIVSDSRRNGAPDEVVAEYHMARLIWLNWWVQWALKNCKKPAISNS